jgi:hypothetical protein
MAVNYNDPRFQQVNNEKQQALNEVDSTYNNMINTTDKLYQDQINASKDWADKESALQQQKTDFALDKINQEKEWAKQDYLKEQKASYVDYQKQTDPYGNNAEQMASLGLTGTGYAESSKVAMYTAYQNRVATARESFNRAITSYDLAYKDAQLQNNSALLEIAKNALQTQLQLSLEGFQYKNQLLQQQLQTKHQTEDRYYNRWQNVLNQINTEQDLAERQRQFNQQMAIQQREIALQEQAYSVAKQNASAGGGSSKVKQGGAGYDEDGFYSEISGRKDTTEAVTSLTKAIDSATKGFFGGLTKKNTAREMINQAYKQGTISPNDVKKLSKKYGLD